MSVSSANYCWVAFLLLKKLKHVPGQWRVAGNRRLR